MQKHFVTFYSPGTFMSETDEYPIKSWDVDEAVKMSLDIHQRHGARPYGFRFSTRGRGPKDLDSKEIKSSGIYWLGGRVETLEQVKARNAPDERILRTNMENNKHDKIVINENSYRFTYYLDKDDVVLDIDWRAMADKKGKKDVA